ncbi:unnamed protein product [Ixodes pacificus]
MVMSKSRLLSIRKTSEFAASPSGTNAPKHEKTYSVVVVVLITKLPRTFLFFNFYAPPFCQSRPFPLEGAPTSVQVCSLYSAFRWRWKTGGTIPCFRIAYTSERKHFVFALALCVPHCACAEPEIAVSDWRMATTRL